MHLTLFDLPNVEIITVYIQHWSGKHQRLNAFSLIDHFASDVVPESVSTTMTTVDILVDIWKMPCISQTPLNRV